MEKQFELNYAASLTEAKAQVQAYLNAVGNKLCEIDEHESVIMESISFIDFISETLPNLKSGAETACSFTKGWISFLEKKCDSSKEHYKDHASNVEPEDVKNHILLSLDKVKSLISQMKEIYDSLIYLTQAADLLLWAEQNGDLAFKLKMYLLDETSRFQMNYWQLTTNND